MTDADADSDRLSPPTPVGPCDATAVNGNEATFAWEPSSGADRYRLQIANTARFEELLLDEDVGNETAVTVGNQLPTDGQTLFWRVRSGSATDWGPASDVESFVASTEEEAEQELLAPEDAGPVTELARATKREITRQVFEFEDQFEEEKERGVAYEGIAANQIMAIAVAILVVILIAVVVLFNWYGQVTQETRASASNPADYQMLRQTEMEATQDLTQYGVVESEEGVYRIPIDRAMDLIATEEYQQRQSAAQGQEGRPGE